MFDRPRNVQQLVQCFNSVAVCALHAVEIKDTDFWTERQIVDHRVHLVLHHVSREFHDLELFRTHHPISDIFDIGAAYVASSEVKLSYVFEVRQNLANRNTVIARQRSVINLQDLYVGDALEAGMQVVASV